MADFISKVPSADFDKALQGGLDAANGRFAEAEDVQPAPVQSVNGKTGVVQLGAEDVGADAAGTAAGQVGSHNVSEAAHNDIRLFVEALATRVNALANSEDVDLDQMAELVAYIKANRELIEQITTNKVNVSDIVNDLVTNVANRPLSAAQGVALKSLIDAITIPTKVSQLTNDKGYLTDYTETDPTVPAWAKTPEKPEYTAQEVGARPASWMPSAADVGADPKGTASGAVSAHNVSDAAHNDIRLLIEGLTTQLNALADSDDTTLDQMSEFVAYVKANRSLIESITTSKVNVSDIINNLTTNVSGKPLSAAQGVALKSLIDGLSTGKLDVSAVADWAKAATKPSYTKSEVGLGNVDNTRQYSASNPPPYPVTSVNGKTGAVQIDVTQDVEDALEAAKESGAFTGPAGTSVTVQSVSESTIDGGSNVVTFSDGKKLTVKNGKTGSKGDPGPDGKTPVRGTDYWTDADKAEIKAYVDEAILGGAW